MVCVAINAEVVASNTLETELPNTHRILDPQLGGGALLDL